MGHSNLEATVTANGTNVANTTTCTNKNDIYNSKDVVYIHWTF